MKPKHGETMASLIPVFHRLLPACLLLLAPAVLNAAVQADLDRYRIVEGETVTLTIRTDDPRQNLDADFSVLEADFEILDRRSETQLSIVNGKQTAVVRLLLTLEPRRAGRLKIPPLLFGQDRTGALDIRVEPAPEPEPGAPPPVFIEVEVTPEAGPYYVHGQLGLVVRVFYQQNLTEAAISPPEADPASVRLLQETPYQAERSGERYRVLERVYALFPERSGELLIPPMKLTGRLVARNARSVWQPTSRGRRIEVESDAVTLTIESRPQSFSGAEWQPARDYRLTQQVSSGEALRVGEPITRTVIVDAIGLEENMIVEPVWPDVPDVRIYPDQPQGITRDDGRWVLGHKEFRYAVVPEKEGELRLPELRVEWWDTKNDRQRTAVLEAHTVFVQSAALVPAPTPSVDGRAEPVAAPLSVSVPEAPYWRLLASLFAFLWIVTLLVAWRQRGRHGAGPESGPDDAWRHEDEAGALSELKKACGQNDSRQARRALRHWLYGQEPDRDDPTLLGFAASLEDKRLSESVYVLDADGFRQGHEEAWDGKTFWKQFEAWRRQHRAASAGNPDPTDLYARENRFRG
jgi:hypothetical protein